MVDFISKAQLRKELFQALSEMYAREVPLYDKLLETVRDVNRDFVKAHPELGLSEAEVDAISAERHGAIRLGRPDEMRMMARFFSVVGMEPVNFYNLADAGNKSQPVISTAFRPIEHCDQRIFCSLLMTDFFDEKTQMRVDEALRYRDIFPPRLVALIDYSENFGAFDRQEADLFLTEAKKLFGWKAQAKDKALYDDLSKAGFLIAADICCFPNPHLNHLTPNTFDMDALYAELKRRLKDEYAAFDQKGMKDSIEGPPAMEALILLRQTSYRALTETVEFLNKDGTKEEGKHTARFGEIEQRGVAMTEKGRALYDAAIAKTQKIDPKLAATDYDEYVRQYTECFAYIPTNHDDLRKQGYAFYEYRLTEAGKNKDEAIPRGASMENLISAGYVEAVPIRYDDFLPVSAAGIFASNLEQAGMASGAKEKPKYDKRRLENIMGRTIVESNDIYAAREARSKKEVYAALGASPERAEMELLEQAIKKDPIKKGNGNVKS